MSKFTLKIKDIAESGADLDLSCDRAQLKDALEGLDADLVQSRAAARMHLVRVGDTVTLHGQLDGEIVLPCVRCLGAARMPLHVPLRVVIGPEELAGEQGEEESADAAGDEENEVEYYTHDGEVIDLEPVVRESLVLSVPMAPLCRDECKGLCPVCGGDRNERDCGCEAAPDEHPFAALKDFKL